MKITTDQILPSTKELASWVASEFPGYSTKLFGLACHKTLIVKKSAFVGVQITRRDHELVIEGSLPSISTSILSGFLMLEGIFYLFEFVFHSQWDRLEKEVGSVLNHKFK